MHAQHSARGEHGPHLHGQACLCEILLIELYIGRAGRIGTGRRLRLLWPLPLQLVKAALQRVVLLAQLRVRCVRRLEVAQQCGVPAQSSRRQTSSDSQHAT